MQTITVTEYNGYDISEMITALVKDGEKVTVNGHLAIQGWGPASICWNNGTVSIKAKAQKTGTYKDVYFKIGAVMNIS